MFGMTSSRPSGEMKERQKAFRSQFRIRDALGGGEAEVNGEQQILDNLDQEEQELEAKQPERIEAEPAEGSCLDCTGSIPCRRHMFPLMSVPTEIRLHIYRIALSRDTPVLLHMAQPKPPSKEPPTQKPYSRNGMDMDTTISVYNGHGHQYREIPTYPLQRAHQDPLIPNLLLVSKQIHSEARPVLYSENNFVLQLDSAVYTLTKLRQPSRSLIKHVSLTVPSHHHVLEGFADLVRLGLRYCWGLQTFTIALPSFLPRDREVGSNGTNVYANAFHILRWLPQSAIVVLDGGATEEIRRVVEENSKMAKSLDRTSYLRRQHQMPERV